MIATIATIMLLSVVSDFREDRESDYAWCAEYSHHHQRWDEKPCHKVEGTTWKAHTESRVIPWRIVK